MTSATNRVGKGLNIPQGIGTVPIASHRRINSNNSHVRSAIKDPTQKGYVLGKNTTTKKTLAHFANLLTSSVIQGDDLGIDALRKERNAKGRAYLSNPKSTRSKRVRMVVNKENDLSPKRKKQTRELAHDLTKLELLQSKCWTADGYDNDEDGSGLWARLTPSPVPGSGVFSESPMFSDLSDDSVCHSETVDWDDVGVLEGIDWGVRELLKQSRHTLVQPEGVSDGVDLGSETWSEVESFGETSSSKAIAGTVTEGQVALDELEVLKRRLENVDRVIETFPKTKDRFVREGAPNETSSINEIIDAVEGDSSGRVLAPRGGAVRRTIARCTSQRADEDCDLRVYLERRFDPGMYAMKLLEEDAMDKSKNAFFNQANDREEFRAEGGEPSFREPSNGLDAVETCISALEDRFMSEFLQKAAEELEEKGEGQSLTTRPNNAYGHLRPDVEVIDANEIQQLLPYTLSHLRELFLASSSPACPSAPLTTTTGATATTDAGQEPRKDATRSLGEEAKQAGLAPSEECVRSEQHEALLKSLLEMYPAISQEMQDEFARLRRQVDHLTSVQQEHLQRLRREQQAESWRRLLGPRTTPPIDSSLKAPYTEEETKTKALRAFGVPATQEHGPALPASTQALPNTPLPSLIKLSTSDPVRTGVSYHPPTAAAESNENTLLEREARFYEKELYRVKDEYNRLLVDEKQRHREERKAFLRSLKHQYTTLSSQYKQTIDALQREARMRERAQQGLLERQILAEQAAGREARSLEQKQRYAAEAAAAAAKTAFAPIATKGAPPLLSSFSAATPTTAVVGSTSRAPRRRTAKALAQAQHGVSSKKSSRGAGPVKPTSQPGKPNEAQEALAEEPTKEVAEVARVKVQYPVIQLPDGDALFREQENAKLRWYTTHHPRSGKGLGGCSTKPRRPQPVMSLSPYRSRRLGCGQGSRATPAPRPEFASSDRTQNPHTGGSHVRADQPQEQEDRQGEAASPPAPSQGLTAASGSSRECVGAMAMAPNGDMQPFTVPTPAVSRIPGSNAAELTTPAGSRTPSCSVGQMLVFVSAKPEAGEWPGWLPGQPPLLREMGQQQRRAVEAGEAGVTERPLRSLPVGCPPHGASSFDASLPSDVSRTRAHPSLQREDTDSPWKAPLPCDYYSLGESTMNDCPRYWHLVEAVEAPRGGGAKRDPTALQATPAPDARLLPVEITLPVGEKVCAVEIEAEPGATGASGRNQDHTQRQPSPTQAIQVSRAMASEAATLLSARHRLNRIRHLFLVDPSLGEAASLACRPFWCYSGHDAPTPRGAASGATDPHPDVRDRRAQQLQDAIVQETIHSILGEFKERTLFAEVLEGLEADLVSAWLREEVLTHPPKALREARETPDKAFFAAPTLGVPGELLHAMLEDALQAELRVWARSQPMLEEGQPKLRQANTCEGGEKPDGLSSSSSALAALQVALAAADPELRVKAAAETNHVVVPVPQVASPAWVKDQDTGASVPLDRAACQRLESDVVGAPTPAEAASGTPSVVLSIKAASHEGKAVVVAREEVPADAMQSAEVRAGLSTRTAPHTVNVVLDFSNMPPWSSFAAAAVTQGHAYALRAPKPERGDRMQTEQLRCAVPEEDLQDVEVESVIVLPACTQGVGDRVRTSEPAEVVASLRGQPEAGRPSPAASQMDSKQGFGFRKDANVWEEGDGLPDLAKPDAPDDAASPQAYTGSTSLTAAVVTPTPAAWVGVGAPGVVQARASVCALASEAALQDVVRLEARRRESLSHHEVMQWDCLTMLWVWSHRLQETTKRGLPSVAAPSSPMSAFMLSPPPPLSSLSGATTPAPAGTMPGEIRDPVTRFIFNWLESYNERQARQRADPTLPPLPAEKSAHEALQGQPHPQQGPRRQEERGSLPLQSPTSLRASTSTFSSSWLTSTHPSSYDTLGGHRFLHANEQLVQIPPGAVALQAPASRTGPRNVFPVPLSQLRRRRPVLDASVPSSRAGNGGNVSQATATSGVTTRYTTTTATTRRTTPPSFASIDRFSQNATESNRFSSSSSPESPPPHPPGHSLSPPPPDPFPPHFPWLVDSS